jgi:flagellar biosynthesis/type III secretory pathway chaperone
MDKTKAPVVSPVLKEFVGVMDKLKAIIETENEFLERGLPPALLATTKRKSILSREYSALSNELLDAAAEQLMNDPILPTKLAEAGAELQAMSTENRQLLEMAVAASKRRIDSVMDAVRASADAEFNDQEPIVGPDFMPRR